MRQRCINKIYFLMSTWLALITFGFSVEGAETHWPQVTWHSVRTRQELSQENYNEAYAHGIAALSSEPLRPELQINLGNTLEALGQLTKANQAYSAAGKLSDDPSVIFQSRFNQGNVLAKDKKVEQALEQYQKALELNPDSKEVKINIELLLQSQGGQGGEGGEKGDPSSEAGNDSEKGKDPKKFAENPRDQKNGQNQKPTNLSASDIKKILEELKQQEQRIRGDYYRQGQQERDKESSEGRREKDW